MNPGLVRTATSTHLGDDHQTIRIRMERPLDNLIGHMRTVEVAGVNVVHAGLYGLPQNRDGEVNVGRRSPYLRTSKLHCTVAHAIYGHRSARQSKAAGEI